MRFFHLQWLLHFLLVLVMLFSRSQCKPLWLLPAPVQLVVPSYSHGYFENGAPQYIIHRAVEPIPPPQKGPIRLFLLSFTRFPWPIEAWVQRLQNYFSTYTLQQQEAILAAAEAELQGSDNNIPVDALEPEHNGSHPDELPNPTWMNNQISSTIDMVNTNKEQEIPRPSWSTTSSSITVPTESENVETTTGVTENTQTIIVSENTDLSLVTENLSEDQESTKQVNTFFLQ